MNQSTRGQVSDGVIAAGFEADALAILKAKVDCGGGSSSGRRDQGRLLLLLW